MAEERIPTMSNLAITVVTCTIYSEDKFLVIRRRDGAKKFGGKWGFPGGKVEQGETIVGALQREVEEETGLRLEDRLLFVDSYFYGDTLGLHFTAFAISDDVTPEPEVEFKWLASLHELQELPRIPGIDYHITRTQALLKQDDALLSMRELNYTPDKYVN